MKSLGAIEFIEDRKSRVCHFPEVEYVVSDLDAEQAVDLAEEDAAVVQLEKDKKDLGFLVEMQQTLDNGNLQGVKEMISDWISELQHKISKME